MTRFLDSLLNRITMYRIALYYVGGLLAAAFALGFVNLVPGDPTALTFSAVTIGAVCWATNKVFSTLFRVAPNTDSVWITAIILALILPPVTAADKAGVTGLFVASFVAIASKYLLAIHRKHVFNPVAIGVVASSILLDQPATWWVGGNLPLMGFVVLGGLLVLRKVQRFEMFGVYVLANLAVSLAFTSPSEWTTTLYETLVNSPLFFAGFAMLTEPLTAPDARLPRLVFGAIVGALSSAAVHIGDFYLTPEMAFLAGNVFAWVVSPKGRYRLTLLRIEELASGSYDYVFKSNRRLNFRPGQYLDWTLDVRHPDDRGNRRTFTIASAPTESEVRVGVKFYAGPSTYKQTMLRLRPGDVIYASNLAGSFTLPRNRDEKLAFIAGGIGVTPFRSMVQHMIDLGEPRNAIMLYGNNRLEEIAYAHVFEQAEYELGLKTVYAVTDGATGHPRVHPGFIDRDLIRREVPDYKERTFYISGPHSMVVAFRQVLRDLGISQSRIKVDFFPGFA
jgi:glycine betaine catabolism B